MAKRWVSSGFPKILRKKGKIKTKVNLSQFYSKKDTGQIDKATKYIALDV